jgi:hypothetical protein
MNTQKFLDLIDAIKSIGNNGHFELLLYIKLTAIGKPFDQITVGELIAAARAAGELQTKLAGERTNDCRCASDTSPRLP